jgi:hypothetical protein
MIRKRFSSWRVAKVVGLTTAALTWSAALFARLVGFPTAEATVPPPDAAPEPQPVTSAVDVLQPALPELPEGGLYIIRATKTEAPQPIVRRVVVQQTSPSQPAPPAPPPRSTVSAGS